MKQQSATEWLSQSLEALANEFLLAPKTNDYWSSRKSIVEKANKMFQEEIIKAYEVGNNDYANFHYVATSGVEYYAIKFKDENDGLNKEE